MKNEDIDQMYDVNVFSFTLVCITLLDFAQGVTHIR